MPVVPTSAFVAFSKITEAIIDPAVETYLRTPVAVIEKKTFAAPTPIPWSPQETDFRRHHPCARHPVIIVEVVAVGPVAGCPNVTVPRTKRLLIDRQRGGANVINTPICANDAADMHSTTSNNNSVRMKRICIVIPLAYHPSFARCCSTAAGCVDREARFRDKIRKSNLPKSLFYGYDSEPAPSASH